MPSALWRLISFVSSLWTFHFFAADAQSLLPVTAKGAKFFDSSGKQFYIKGMNYALGLDDDVLANPKQCALDAPLMKTLLVNTIRVYTVDSTKNHTECMNILEQNGLYVILGLSTPNSTIEASNPQWTQNLFDAFTTTLSEFSQYNNLFAVTVGNEVIDKSADTGAAPYIKAAARDVKAYRDAQKMRQIPVGYSAADVDDIRDSTRDYLVCGGDNTTTIDFFAINDYAWCGPNTFNMSGYAQLYNESLDSPVPLFFSETGCNFVGNRTFDDQIAVLGPDMNQKWSGAMIYEWGEGENKYGIVSYPSATVSGTTTYGSTGTPTPITPDFYNLQSQWDTLTPTGVARSTYSFAGTTPACPTSDSTWPIVPTSPLPTIKNLVIPTKTIAAASGAPEPESKGGSTTSNQVPTATSTPEASDKTSGLSTGAKVAIGVCVPIAVIALAVLAFLLWRRKKEAASAAATTEYSHMPQMQDHNIGADGFPPAQLHGDDARVEPDSNMRYQLSDEAQIVPELRSDADVTPQELSSGPSVRRNARRLSYESP